VDHRALCRLTAWWLLRERRVWLSGYEVQFGRGQVDVLGVSYPWATPFNAQHAADLRGLEGGHRAARSAAQQQALTESLSGPPETRAARLQKRGRELRPPHPHLLLPDIGHGPGTILVAECKVQRPDLLRDLRARKMLLYERDASRCLLVCGPDVLPEDGDEALADLGERGLPAHWGVLRTAPSLRDLSSLRPGRAHRQIDEAGPLHVAHGLLTRALTYKLLRDASPEGALL